MPYYFVNSKKITTFANDLRNQVCPDGGIGRRVGLKHQYFTVYGFESRSGHQ